MLEFEVGDRVVINLQMQEHLKGRDEDLTLSLREHCAAHHVGIIDAVAPGEKRVDVSFADSKYRMDRRLISKLEVATAEAFSQQQYWRVAAFANQGDLPGTAAEWLAAFAGLSEHYERGVAAVLSSPKHDRASAHAATFQSMGRPVWRVMEKLAQQGLELFTLGEDKQAATCLAGLSKLLPWRPGGPRFDESNVSVLKQHGLTENVFQRIAKVCDDASINWAPLEAAFPLPANGAAPQAAAVASRTHRHGA